MKKQLEYHNLSDKERECYNLPPQGFQGNEFTVVLQAPTSVALQKQIDDFHGYAKRNDYEHFEVLTQGSDPDGGFKAVAMAHNFNPVTWTSEQYHRAKLGVTKGWKKGKEKAEITHEISSVGELEAAKAREVTLQRARLARIEGAAPERIATEREVGKLLEERRRQRRLASITGEAIPGTQQQTMTEYVFGSMPI